MSSSRPRNKQAYGKNPDSSGSTQKVSRCQNSNQHVGDWRWGRMSTGVARLQAAFLHPDNTCSTPSTIIVSQTRISSALLGCLSLPSKQSESLTVHLRSPDTVLGMKDLKTETTASLNFTADSVVFLSQCTLRSHLTLLSVFLGGV